MKNLFTHFACTMLCIVTETSLPPFTILFVDVLSNIPDPVEPIVFYLLSLVRIVS